MSYLLRALSVLFAFKSQKHERGQQRVTFGLVATWDLAPANATA